MHMVNRYNRLNLMISRIHRMNSPAQIENLAAVKQIFAPLQIHLPIWAVLAGEAPGDVLTDSQQHPSAALLRCNQRLYLAGQPDPARSAGWLVDFFAQVYQGTVPGLDEFSLCFSEGWRPVLEDLLADHLPLFVQRQYYEIETLPTIWQPTTPEGLQLHLADLALLSLHLVDIDDLREEMCSERPSVQDFLQKSFGLCPVAGGSLVGWCLSEYNLGDRCEVGIAVLPPYQRRGIATWLTHAFIDEAHRRGVARVGWHCYASNRVSGATALKAGLRQICDYPTLIGITDPVINLGAHGNQFFWRDEFETALIWYRHAMQQSAALAWIYWNAACCAARCGLPDEAFQYLHAALDNGFEDQQRLGTSPHLESLRSLPGWQELLQRG